MTTNEIIIAQNSQKSEVVESLQGDLTITLERGAECNLLLLGGGDSEGVIKAKLQNGSKLHITVVEILGEKCGKISHSIEVDLDGSGADYRVGGVFIARDSQRIDIKSIVRHNVMAATSDQNFRGVASGEANAEFSGLIYVAQGADQTVALQNNHNVLLSDQATIKSEPQLEIYADDVKCNHGATVGKQDTEALFYMRQRGIELKDAQALLLESFCYSALDGLVKFDQEIQDRVREELEGAISAI